KKIKTVFWNKEDPFHFERFSDSASFFDIIYTTDADSINRYDSLLDHRCQSVGVLMFAAQPHWYKSVPQVKRKYGVAFFGGYYGNQFSERSQMQYDVLHSLSRCGLVIYDRFWNKKNNCSYPNDLHVYCRPSIPLNLVAQAYTQYQIYLNFNTIRKSTTMLSRRVFELGASGCSIISSPSIAMNRIFEDSIISIANGQSAREWCLELQKDINKRTVLGERAKEIVLSQHTWHHRLQQMNRDFELY
ncbi:glycosyltransferase, partial [Escherichia coli]|nr:glycosyltransferase [Escherichia coli]